MQQMMSIFDDSLKLNQTPVLKPPAYHPPYKHYKIIHQGLMIPNLPAPLHYFNFLSIIGQPNAPMLRNASALLDDAPITVATVISSVSGHMTGHLNRYNIPKECQFSKDKYIFADREYLTGRFPEFRLQRDDPELSVDLKIKTTTLMTHFTKLKLSLFEHWSVLCECTGIIHYQNITYPIQQLGSFEYARAINFPYLPLSFFTYQIININEHQQMLLAQIRNNLNQIVQSRIYIRDTFKQQTLIFDKNVKFIIHRIYPAVHTPNLQKMYLPREFEWQYEDAQHKIQIKAESRGDYKFGLAAGYVGSFKYQIFYNDKAYQGESGYCEYIDCRPLKWQEHNKEEKLLQELANTVPILLKK